VHITKIQEQLAMLTLAEANQAIAGALAKAHSMKTKISRNAAKALVCLWQILLQNSAGEKGIYP
jgi:hypothetical protein